ncbi:MAG: ribonuclease HII [Eubacteriales bacterium]|nr:ribonuclease HII [Eubacteriales bacterium]
MNAKDRRLKLYEHDCGLWREGLVFAGIDEAGRGPLAGSVVTACVVWEPGSPMIPYIDDSKKLSEDRREKVCEIIMRQAAFVGIGEASAQEIDDINILQATKLAMRRAAKGAPVELFYIDAVTDVGLFGEERPVIRGDAVCYAIAAASVVAKVTRDRQMRALEETYPAYGFARHKGYGTAAHMEAIRDNGLCPLHRRSFLKRFLAQ